MDWTKQIHTQVEQDNYPDTGGRKQQYSNQEKNILLQM